MNLLNKTKVIFGLIVILILSAMASCARLTTPVVPLTGSTATPTKTATTSTSGSTLMWDDFDEAPWVGWSSSGGNGYLVAMYMQNGTFNNGTQNTTIHQGGTGSLDLNVNFTSATSNLLEVTIEDGTMYGGSADETTGGYNPGSISFWVNPSVAMQMSKIYINAPAGTNTAIVNTTALPAGVWTNVVQSLSSIPAGVMANTKAVIFDMTCPTTGVVDVRVDSIGFTPSTVTVTPTSTGTSTATATITSTPTVTKTPTITTTIFSPTATPTKTATSAPTPTGSSMWDDFDEGPWVGWSNSGSNGYLVSTYTQNATFNSGTQNTIIHQGGSGSLDLNVTFTAATGNLLETTIENGDLYGATVDETTSGVNPGQVSFWVNPSVAMQISKIFINAAGVNTGLTNTTALPAGVWTNVVQSLAGVPSGNMASTKAVIIDLTCPTTGTADVRFDSISFLSSTVTVTPTWTGTATATGTTTNTPTITATPTITTTVFPPMGTPTPTPNPNVLFDNFDGGPWAGWTSSGPNGYQISIYTQSAVYNGGTQNTVTTQNGTAGSLDINVTFTATTGNLLETTFESDYGSPVDATGGSGVAPSALSFWVNPTVAMQISKIWIDAPSGTNTPFVNTTSCPAGVWTNIYQPISGISGALMRSTEAIIVDMTCPTATTVDVRYDEMYFYP
jgi:hypothetical protein